LVTGLSLDGDGNHYTRLARMFTLNVYKLLYVKTLSLLLSDIWRWLNYRRVLYWEEICDRGHKVLGVVQTLFYFLSFDIEHILKQYANRPEQTNYKEFKILSTTTIYLLLFYNSGGIHAYYVSKLHKSKITSRQQR